MKNSIKTITLILTALTLGACSSGKVVNPSQNSALNSVSSSQKEKKGAMQESLDNWLNKEWTPIIEKDEVIKEKYSDEKRDFTLQEYVEKSEIYMKESNATTKNSHVDKINAMPVIGK
jgi:hypothetical protein